MVQIQVDILAAAVQAGIEIQMVLGLLVVLVAVAIQQEDHQIIELERQVNFPQEAVLEHQLHTRQVLLEQMVVPES